MKRRGKSIALVAAGIMLGSALAGPAAYAAAGVWAERSNHIVYVDGQRTTLEAYTIDGSNYVRLRDVGGLVGFNVYWDGAVHIESNAPYTGEAPPAVDYSQAANAEVFTGVYTREAYNAIFEVLSALNAGDDTKRATIHIDGQTNRWRLENMLGNLADGYTLSLRGIANGTYEVYAHEVYRNAADPYTDQLVAEWSRLSTDREKVKAANEYLCDRLVYDAHRNATIPEVVSSLEPLRGSCATFACAMNYLCGRLNIPCIRIGGENHFWNLLYVDESWSYTDASLNDQVPDHEYMLFSATARKQSCDPEGIRFLQELLVQGSTK